MIKREELRIRDPFILTDAENGCYYMYTSTATSNTLSDIKLGVAVYRTEDLENFEDPVLVLDISTLPGFWADRDVWAPEVHKYCENYYIFVSLKSESRCRGTQIFKSESPLGPFLPVSEFPITPEDRECLDGTLWVEDGRPYMVFCHEWVQIHDGTVCAVELTPDLSAPAGEPFLLFAASENEHSTLLTRKDGWSGNVTDGPFLYREDGKLKMVWSSFDNGRYVVLGAESDGGIRGSWAQLPPCFEFDGGHSMIFNTLDGRRMIALHAPNYGRLERATFIEF